MTDISAPALEKAKAKVQQLVPNAPRVETKVGGFSYVFPPRDSRPKPSDTDR